MPHKERRYLRVKFIKDQKINLLYEEGNGLGGYDRIDRTMGDEPVPAFRAALDALAKDFTELCELPKEDKKQIRVDAVHLSYHGDDDQLAVVISGIKKMQKSSGAMALSTPVRLARKDKPNAKKDISDTLQEKIDVLVEQANEFLAGKVQQTKAKLS